MKGPLYDSARETVITEPIVIPKPAFANLTQSTKSCR